MKLNRKKRFLLCSLLLALLPLSGACIAGEKPGYPFSEHIDQHTIDQYPVETIYYWGKKIFEAPYNHLDGVGLNMRGDPHDAITLRFARIPRADLPGWLADPVRLSGPAARNCRECHNSHSGNMLNTIFDFPRQGDISNFVERQTTNIGGAGALQLLAEQTSKELWTIRDNAIANAKANNATVEAELLSSNNVSYGWIKAYPDGNLDLSGVSGVGSVDNPFLLARQFQVLPFFAKSEVGFIRITSANPPNGMQSPEQVPEFIDADNDGVVGEMSTGDITAITIYTSAQPRPVSKLELHRHLGGKFRLDRKEIRSIRNGKEIFGEIGCASCHKPKMVIKDPTFNEPSSTPGYSLPFFWGKYISAGGIPQFTSPLPYGYNPEKPVSFSLSDLPSIPCSKDTRRGSKDTRRGWRGKNSCWREFKTNRKGQLVIRLYADQKLHDLGEGLAEGVIGFSGLPGSVWKTKELWGVGSTGPWMHDGRATTLHAAIKWHGGDAWDTAASFQNLAEQDQDDLIAFLNNLVIYNASRNAIQPSGNGFIGE